MATQAESYWLHLSLIQDLVRNARPFFAAVEYAYTQIPTYPLGQIGFLVCSKAQAAGECVMFAVPARCKHQYLR